MKKVILRPTVVGQDFSRYLNLKKELYIKLREGQNSEELIKMDLAGGGCPVIQIKLRHNQ